ncbi:hypothetical protein [Novacetimonas hansenii]|uniref:hypothetical protein n=1 Tax=Novacetimonas hansenii TaxID=436 RepID=UPI0015E87CF1|nr:hypothetical protein [Novacetimonas hansenii]
MKPDHPPPAVRDGADVNTGCASMLCSGPWGGKKVKTLSFEYLFPKKGLPLPLILFPGNLSQQGRDVPGKGRSYRRFYRDIIFFPLFFSDLRNV